MGQAKDELIISLMVALDEKNREILLLTLEIEKLKEKLLKGGEKL